MTHVMYTGGTGRMGTVLRAALAQDFTRVTLLARSKPRLLYPHEAVVQGTLEDLGAVTEAARGVDTIIHLGAIPDEATFESILEANIRGTYHVFEAARSQGVRRVVFASTNHVTGFYSTKVRLTEDMPPRPDSYYAVSKVFGEALGRLYHDKWGIEVVAVRIGSFRKAPENVRQLSLWLSHRDGAQLFRCAVTAPDVGFVTVFGASRNTRGWWDLSNAEKAIGYRPVDDSELYAAELLGADAEHIRGSEGEVQGGAYASQDYMGGLWAVVDDATHP